MKIAEQKPAPSRVIIDQIRPEIDGGKFAAKRYIDQPIKIEAVLLTDGHEVVKGRLHYRHETETEFRLVPMTTKWNDEWSAEFQPKLLGRYFFKVEAALDRFGHWRSDLFKKQLAGQSLSNEFLIGAELLKAIASESRSRSAQNLIHVAQQLKLYGSDQKTLRSVDDLSRMLNDPALELLAYDVYDKQSAVFSEREIPLQVEPLLARYSSWYEFFPRSTVLVSGAQPHHGNLREAAERLDYVRDLGFNVVYFPPIHPVGAAFRKGKNNSLTPSETDVGSPWAIGSKEGGHKSIHPDLGTLKDFDALLERARSLKLEVAMDIAFQCSPDHPYVVEHPEWFKRRADGSIQYAENPPKKYQDIYPLDFESKDWRGLWQELKSVLQHWADRGVKVFRVDNPHTKAFHFWEWAIGEIKKTNPDVVFLAEAFTRPHIMAYLAKIGFTQSYTYFTWRNFKWELEQYMTELTKTELKNYFSPNFWPNTPDINPEPLHVPDRATYLQRLILAATLSSNYGVYGPVFELMASASKGREEYLDSEKYELKQWDLESSSSLAPELKLINQIRRENIALQQNRDFELIPVSNENLLAFSKWQGNERVLVVVNLDSKNVQSGVLDLPLEEWKVDGSEILEIHDLLSDAHYQWSGWKNYVELNPKVWPAHIFKITRNLQTAPAARV